MIEAYVQRLQDYGNRALAGLPTYFVGQRPFQSVQNAPEQRVTCNLRRSDHVTDMVVNLLWLRIPERVVYKIDVLTFNILHGSAPEYTLDPSIASPSLESASTALYILHAPTAQWWCHLSHCQRQRVITAVNFLS